MRVNGQRSAHQTATKGPWCPEIGPDPVSCARSPARSMGGHRAQLGPISVFSVTLYSLPSGSTTQPTYKSHISSHQCNGLVRFSPFITIQQIKSQSLQRTFIYRKISTRSVAERSQRTNGSHGSHGSSNPRKLINEYSRTIFLEIRRFSFTSFLFFVFVS